MKKYLLLFLVFLGACTPKYKEEQPTVINDVKDLSNRVSMKNSELDFITTSTMTSSLPKFVHLADISSPTVNSQKLRATSTLKLDNKLLIAYNTEGAGVSGGVDIIDMSNLTSPTLVSSWQSSIYEFNDIKSKGRALYLAGNKKDVGAVVVIMDIANMSNPVVVNELLVPGQVATSIDLRNDRMFVSSALGGGISRYEVSYNDVLTPTFIRYNPFPNSVFVKALYNPYVDSPGFRTELEPIILGGDADSHIYFMDKELPLSSSVSVAPSKFVMQGPLLYVNTSNGGLKVSEISKFYDGRGFEGFVSNLTLPGTGTGIAHSDQKLYVARGESGVRYVNVDEPGAPTELGYIDFGDEGSANNVWVERYSWTFKVITVADGKGGVRLVLEDTTEFKNAGDWIKIYAKGTPAGGINPIMQMFVNNVLVHTTSVISESWNVYHVNLATPIPFGAEVKFRFANDASIPGVDDRNLSIGYVKIGDDYYYPWWNNYFLDTNILAFGPESDNMQLFWNGYLKLIR